MDVAPKDIRTSLALGNFYAARQQTDEAVAAYRQAVAIDPKALEPKQHPVELYLRQNKLAEAATTIDEMLNSDSGKSIWFFKYDFYKRREYKAIVLTAMFQKAI